MGRRRFWPYAIAILVFLIQGIATCTGAQCTLTGHVYLGYSPDTSHGMNGAKVSVYETLNLGQVLPANLKAAVNTEPNGFYRLVFNYNTDDAAPAYYYQIVLTPPTGYADAGKASVGGVPTAGSAKPMIYYEGLSGKKWDGNNFWLVPQTPPVASFSPNPLSGEAPLTVSFTDSSTGYPTSWSWDFGDTMTASGKTVTAHTYTSPGTYTVRLTVRNPYGSNTGSRSITVSSPDVDASFIADVTYGPAPLTVTFTDTSSGDPVSWQWMPDFDHSPTEVYSTEPSATYTYSVPGSYSVMLWIQNQYFMDDFETKYNYITVTEPQNNRPVALFTADTYSGEIPLTVNFDASGSSDPDGSIARYTWDFGDGSRGYGIRNSREYQETGTYRVTLTVTDNAGSIAQTSRIISVRDTPRNVNPPIAEFSATPLSGPPNLRVQFADLSQGSPTSWYWEFGDGFSSTQSNTNHQYTSPGQYTISLTVTNADGQDIETKEQYITILEEVSPWYGEPWLIGGVLAVLIIGGAMLMWSYQGRKGDGDLHLPERDDHLEVTIDPPSLPADGRSKGRITVTMKNKLGMDITKRKDTTVTLEIQLKDANPLRTTIVIPAKSSSAMAEITAGQSPGKCEVRAHTDEMKGKGSVEFA